MRRRRSPAARSPGPALSERGAASDRHRSLAGRGRGRDAYALRPLRKPFEVPQGAPPPPGARDALRHRTAHGRGAAARGLFGGVGDRSGARPLRGSGRLRRGYDGNRTRHLADRKSVVEGKSVSVRVDLGGRRSIKKKKKKK